MQRSCWHPRRYDPLVLVRSAKRADLDAIMAIYDRAIVSSTATFDLAPLDAGAREQWFARFGSLDPMLVAEDAGHVVGFAYYVPFRHKPAYAQTKETTVYVAEDARGRGVGTALYQELVRRARSSGVHTLIAVLAGANPQSEALHRRFGFEPVGTLREVGFKFGQWVDVAVWQRLL